MVDGCFLRKWQFDSEVICTTLYGLRVCQVNTFFKENLHMGFNKTEQQVEIAKHNIPELPVACLIE